MKIFTRILALAAFATAAFSANAADVTIKFLRPAAWTATPHVHVYCAAGDLANDQAMTPIPDMADWFSYELKNAPDGYNVMFNNGGWEGGQSSNDMYEAVPGNYAYTLDADLKVIRIADPTAPSVTIRLIRPADWTETPHIHIYHAVEGASDVTDVNDQAMTAVAGDAGLFEYVFSNPPANYNVMFNNGGWAGGQVGPIFVEAPVSATYKVVNNEVVLDSTITGIAAVEAADNAEAVYYTLQGVRVAQPERGLFIKVQAGKATKVIL